MPCCARNIGKDGHCKSRIVLLNILSERPNTVQRISSIWLPIVFILHIMRYRYASNNQKLLDGPTSL